MLSVCLSHIPKVAFVATDCCSLLAHGTLLMHATILYMPSELDSGGVWQLIKCKVGPCMCVTSHVSNRCCKDLHPVAFRQFNVLYTMNMNILVV